MQRRLRVECAPLRVALLLIKRLGDVSDHHIGFVVHQLLEDGDVIVEQRQQMPHIEAHREKIKDDVVDVKILVLEPTA